MSTGNEGAIPPEDTTKAARSILIAGGSGLIGCYLAKCLHEQGNSISVVGRNTAKVKNALPFVTALDWQQLPHHEAAFDVIINLAGHSIAAGRWSDANKARLINSRVSTTEQLVSYCIQQEFEGVFINASAIGYYGDQGDNELTEDSTPADCFSHKLCAAWEAALAPLSSYTKIRVCIARFGVVMAKNGGAFEQMSLPFKAKVAVQNGDGAQWFSWVALDDAANALQFLMNTTQASGVFNVVAPQPLTNSDLTQELAQYFKTAIKLRAPASILRLAMGQMADELLLASQRVLPNRLSELGFAYRHRSLNAWLKTLR